jgi:hypothetical protein
VTQAKLIGWMGGVIAVLFTANIGVVVWNFQDLKEQVRVIGVMGGDNSKVIATLLQQNESQQYWLSRHEDRLDGHDAQFQARGP